MALTLNGITLPDEIKWVERHDSIHNIVATEVVTLGGVRDEQIVVLSGTPIILRSDPDSGWIEDGDLIDQLYALSLVPHATYPLVIGSQSFTVKFWHSGASAFKATPINNTNAEDVDILYTVEIRLMSV